MTAVVMISYDLNTPGQDYENLIKKIKSFGKWWHNLDSTWIVKTSQSSAVIRDVLVPLLDKNDGLLVVDVSNSSAAWHGFSDQATKWLKENVWT